MKRTFTNHSQMIAFYDYSEDEMRLIVTLKDGNSYQVDSFNVIDYNSLTKERNKGSYIYHQVFKSENFKVTKLIKLPAKEVQEIVQKQYTKKNTVNRYRGSEGWGNYLAR